MHNLTYWIVILVMLALSAFFSASEIAMNSVNKLRLRKAAGEEDEDDEHGKDGKEKNDGRDGSRSAGKGSRMARLALHISENFTRPLSAILIGNNLANIAASSAATTLVLAWLKTIEGIGDPDGLASVISTAVMTLVVLIFGETVPKILAKQHADTVACAVALPVRILEIIFYPLVLLVTGAVGLLRKIWGKDQAEDDPTVTEEELSTIIETVEEEGVIDEDQSELLQSTLEFPDTTVQEIMTPRIDLVTIDVEDTPEKIRETVHASRFSRIPVYEDSIDNVIGILSLNHYYRACLENHGQLPDIRPLLMEPCLMHKTMKLPAALAMMRQNKLHMAIVIDEYGGTMGAVTMEDILEELVGDIWDESDEIKAELTKTGENTYEVSGDMNLDDFFAEVGVKPGNDFDCEYSTVGGWAVEELDANPHVGDSFFFRNLCIVVAEMDEVRVTKLTVLVGEEEKDEDSTDE